MQFSSKAVTSYEPIVSKYLSLWMDRISEDLCQDDGTLNIAPRISYLTMDISMDCSFTPNAFSQVPKAADWY